MSKRLSLLAALLVGSVLGFTPTVIHNAKVYSLTKFSEEMGCVTAPPEFMADTPAPNAKALICPNNGIVVVFL